MTSSSNNVKQPYLERIEHVWAWITSDEYGEGVCGFLDQRHNQWIPLIAADQARLKSLRQYAIEIAQTSGRTVKLVKFTVREEEEIIKP